MKGYLLAQGQRISGYTTEENIVATPHPQISTGSSPQGQEGHHEALSHLQ